MRITIYCNYADYFCVLLCRLLDPYAMQKRSRFKQSFVNLSFCELPLEIWWTLNSKGIESWWTRTRLEHLKKRLGLDLSLGSKELESEDCWTRTDSIYSIAGLVTSLGITCKYPMTSQTSIRSLE